MQRLGLPTVELTEPVRQRNEAMLAAVAQARLGNYADSIGHLDKVVSGASSDVLAAGLVEEWARLSSRSRDRTNITRAQFGVKLWTEDAERLAEKLTQKSGEKTSSLEGLGRLDRSSIKGRAGQHGARLERLREQQLGDREARRARRATESAERTAREPDGIAAVLAGRAQSAARFLDRWIVALVDRNTKAQEKTHSLPASGVGQDEGKDRGGSHDR